MRFSQKLKDEQKRLVISQAEMARILGVSPRSVWQWISDKASPLEVTQEGVMARLGAVQGLDALDEFKDQ